MSKPDTSTATGLVMDLQRHADDMLSDDFWSNPGEAQEPDENPAPVEPEDDDTQALAPDDEPQESETDDEPDASEAEPAPKKWADRFDRPEDLEQSYKYLQAELTRLKQGLQPRDPERLQSMMGEQPQAAPQWPQAAPGYPQGYPQSPPQQWQQPNVNMQQMQAQAQQQLQQDAAGAQDPNAFWREFSKNPAATMNAYIQAEIQKAAAPIQQFVTQTQLRNVINDMRADADNYPGFRELEGDIAQYLTSYPHLAQTPDGIRHAYHAVRGINAATAQGFVQQAQQEQRAQVADTKARASVESQKARSQPKRRKAPDEEIGDAIVAAARRARFTVN